MRGPAGAVTCETRDLGFRWPHWHTLVFSDETKLDLRHVCPRDVKKILVQRARSGYRKKWAAKHELEELKEGARLEPGLALLRRKVREKGTDKHRNVPGRSSWKVVGRKGDCSTLAGRMQENAKPA